MLDAVRGGARRTTVFCRGGHNKIATGSATAARHRAGGPVGPSSDTVRGVALWGRRVRLRGEGESRNLGGGQRRIEHVHAGNLAVELEGGEVAPAHTQLASVVDHTTPTVARLRGQRAVDVQLEA